MSDDLLPELWDIILTDVGYDGARRCLLVCRAWMQVFADPNSRHWHAIFLKTEASRPAWLAENWREAVWAREPEAIIKVVEPSQIGPVDLVRVHEIRDRAKIKLGAWVKSLAALKRFDDQTHAAFAAFVSSLDIELLHVGPSFVQDATPQLSGCYMRATARMGDLILCIVFVYHRMDEVLPAPRVPARLQGEIGSGWRVYEQPAIHAFPCIRDQNGYHTQMVHAQLRIDTWSISSTPSSFIIPTPGCGPETVAAQSSLVDLFTAAFVALAPGPWVEDAYELLGVAAVEMAICNKDKDEDKAERDAWRALHWYQSK